MSQALHLYRLQKVDTQLDQIRSRLNAINQILSANAALQQAQQSLSDLNNQLRQAKAALQAAEYEVQAQTVKIELSEKSLYGGKVQNPKELRDLQMEVAALKRHQATLEDHQLDAMVHTEELESQVETATHHLHSVEADTASQHQQLFQERERIQGEVSRLDAERQAVVAAIAAGNLQRYEQLRVQRKGVAVATVEDESCAVCGATLTPAEWQTARSPQQVSFCSSCGRILYAG